MHILSSIELLNIFTLFVYLLGVVKAENKVYFDWKGELTIHDLMFCEKWRCQKAPGYQLLNDMSTESVWY